MKTYKVLVLTDHRGHSIQNSIYSLLTEMNNHPQCQHIDVASRGIVENNAFFQYMKAEAIHGVRVDSNFSFTEDGIYFSEGLIKLKLCEYDIIFMRLPRPITDEWLLWLEAIKNQAIIVNKPSGIIKTSNKEYLLNIPEVCPILRKINTIQDVIDFSSLHPIVLKPLREYGGKGVVKVVGNKIYDGNVEHDRDTFLKSIEETINIDGYIGMKYLKNVTQGDKRILVVGGEIMAASLRLPAEGSWLCNVSQGGKSIAAEIANEEHEIIKSISPQLFKEGILIYGADTLVDDDGKRVLSEINTLSIGGFPQAQEQSGRPIIKQTIDKIFEYADDNG